MFTTQRYDSVLSWAQVPVTTSAVLLSGLVTQSANSMQGLLLTNNDPAATIYLGFDATVSATKFVWKITAGTTIDELIGHGVFGKLYVIGSGACNLSAAVMQ